MLPAIRAALLYVLSSLPDLRISPDAFLDLVLRKAGHFTVFAVLAVLAWGSFASVGWRRPAWTAPFGVDDLLVQAVSP